MKKINEMTKDYNVNMYAKFCKVDKSTHMVYGYATTGSVDSDGEIITLDASFRAIDEWKKWRNIKEMHRPETAVGVAPIVEKHQGIGVYIGAEIVDPVAWAKVDKGVYKGFSIGGVVEERDADNPLIITDYELMEISLVDRPANPDAMFIVAKRYTDTPSGVDGGDNMKKQETSPEEEKPKVTPSEEVKPETPKEEPEAKSDSENTEKNEKKNDSSLKEEFEKLKAEKLELEKKLEQANKEAEAIDIVMSKIDNLKPEMKKSHQEIAGTKKIDLEKEINKMSMGDLTAMMLKGVPSTPIKEEKEGE